MSVAALAVAVVSVAEAAATLNISPYTIRRMLAAGDLRYIRLGKSVRIPVDAIEELLNAPPTEPVRSYRMKDGGE